MPDLLPSELINAIRGRYLSGIADAQAKFALSRADEDALTGALGSAMSMAEPATLQIGDEVFEYYVYYEKVRGRGAGAPERLYGLDGLFQIQVMNSDGEVVRTKALPFQAKTEWKGSDQRLLAQVQKMLDSGIRDAIVINYTRYGYEACAIESVVNAKADHAYLEKARRIHSLTDMLINGFLECQIGERDLYFDRGTEELKRLGEKPLHLISARIRNKRKGKKALPGANRTQGTVRHTASRVAATVTKKVIRVRRAVL